MSPSLPSDEVAEDYKHGLEDLVTNDRYQINILTTIAKENIEHAEAISRVLINHINRTPPSRKLPALYVLDSLVKNIGSPYTIYLGRNLHSTFMLAYSQVDAAIRRKLEETLRTWREPVPGSSSTTSVFPLQSTQSIVDALNRFKASTTPVPGRHPQHPMVNGRASAQLLHRGTPTPPQTQLPMHPMFPGQGPPTSAAHQYPYNNAPAPNPPYTHSPAPQYQAPTPQPSSSVDVAQLHADIDDLTTDAKIECATHPRDSSASRKLVTLQTLKELLDAGTASEQDLLDIKNTIAQEMTKKAANQHQHQHQHQPQAQPVPQALPTYQHPFTQPQPQYPTPGPAPAPTPTPSFLNSANLAHLLEATAKGPQGFSAPYPPVPPPFNGASNTPIISGAVPTPVAPPAIPASALPLLAQLRASGLLSGTLLPAETNTPPPPPPPGLPSWLNPTTDEVKFTSASIRISRPQMVAKFLDDKPNQCSTCGKRFGTDNTSKEKKARHLDWHFKTKARMVEAEKRGQNRSWYVDEREWIANKEFDDDAGWMDDAALNDGSSPATAAKKKAQDFVRAPTDPVLRNAPCPIDQEPFKSEWSEEVQDFIWKDAIRVGDRYYHASCYKEATQDRDKDGNRTPLGAGTTRTATPESVLGKRKAQQEAGTVVTSKVKLEA